MDFYSLLDQLEDLNIDFEAVDANFIRKLVMKIVDFNYEQQREDPTARMEKVRIDNLIHKLQLYQL